MARRRDLPNFSMEQKVAKPEWGSKRICPSCGTRYYDLMREPVVCPKCSTPFDPEAFLKSRRARPAAPADNELEPVGADDLATATEPDEAEIAEVADDAVPVEHSGAQADAVH